MDSDPTARDRVPALQPLTPESTVGEAGSHMRATGERVSVVVHRGRPVGVVSAAVVADAVRAGRCEAPVQSVMDYVAVPVRRGADAGEVLRTFNRAAWEWLRVARPATYRNRREPVTG
jgi:CBS domain-containing protein